jgi:hypothetical protein
VKQLVHSLVVILLLAVTNFTSFAFADDGDDLYTRDARCDWADQAHIHRDDNNFIVYPRYQFVCGKCIPAGEDEAMESTGQEGCKKDQPIRPLMISQKKKVWDEVFTQYKSAEFPGPCFRNLKEERIRKINYLNNCTECTYCGNPIDPVGIFKQYVSNETINKYLDKNSGLYPEWGMYLPPNWDGQEVYFRYPSCHSITRDAGYDSVIKITETQKTPTSGPDCKNPDTQPTMAITRSERDRDYATCKMSNGVYKPTPAYWSPPKSQKTESSSAECSSSSSSSSDEPPPPQSSSSDSSTSSNESNSNSDSSSSSDGSSSSYSSYSWSSDSSGSSESSTSSQDSNSSESSASSEDSSSSASSDSSQSSSSWWWFS